MLSLSQAYSAKRLSAEVLAAAVQRASSTASSVAASGDESPMQVDESLDLLPDKLVQEEAAQFKTPSAGGTPESHKTDTQGSKGSQHKAISTPEGFLQRQLWQTFDVCQDYGLEGESPDLNISGVSSRADSSPGKSLSQDESGIGEGPSPGAERAAAQNLGEGAPQGESVPDYMGCYPALLQLVSDDVLGCYIHLQHQIHAIGGYGCNGMTFMAMTNPQLLQMWTASLQRVGTCMSGKQAGGWMLLQLLVAAFCEPHDTPPSIKAVVVDFMSRSALKQSLWALQTIADRGGFNQDPSNLSRGVAGSLVAVPVQELLEAVARLSSISQPADSGGDAVLQDSSQTGADASSSRSEGDAARNSNESGGRPQSSGDPARVSSSSCDMQEVGHTSSGGEAVDALTGAMSFGTLQLLDTTYRASAAPGAQLYVLRRVANMTSEDGEVHVGLFTPDGLGEIVVPLGVLGDFRALLELPCWQLVALEQYASNPKTPSYHHAKMRWSKSLLLLLKDARDRAYRTPELSPRFLNQAQYDQMVQALLTMHPDHFCVPVAPLIDRAMQLRRDALAPAVTFDAALISSMARVFEGLQGFLDQVQAGVGLAEASASMRLAEEGPAMLYPRWAAMQLYGCGAAVGGVPHSLRQGGETACEGHVPGDEAAADASPTATEVVDAAAAAAAGTTDAAGYGLWGYGDGDSPSGAVVDSWSARVWQSHAEGQQATADVPIASQIRTLSPAAARAAEAAREAAESVLLQPAAAATGGPGAAAWDALGASGKLATTALRARLRKYAQNAATPYVLQYTHGQLRKQLDPGDRPAHKQKYERLPAGLQQQFDAVAQLNGLNALMLLGAMGAQVTKQDKVASFLIDLSAEEAQQQQLPAC